MVEGQIKAGVNKIAFIDLQVPVSCLNITINNPPLGDIALKGTYTIADRGSWNDDRVRPTYNPLTMPPSACSFATPTPPAWCTYYYFSKEERSLTAAYTPAGVLGQQEYLATSGT